jgi:LPS export ABC transporter permease LptF/LPS export ABC transporter permease LptG
MRTIGGHLVERYIITAILPYLGLSLMLLTFVLLAQQAGRFVEILGSADPSLEVVADIALGLIPNILIFTLPMSVLIGTATGLSRLASDSELIAMRAAGVGTWRVVSPVLLNGAFFTLLTLYVGFEVAPKATVLMRQAAIRATLSKIESPIQPNTFNTELPGKVVYVREGDKTRGEWGRVFIHWQDGEREVRLITSRSGRLDTTNDQTELVLSDAMVTTIPTQVQLETTTSSQVVTESSAQFRIRLNTGRTALINKLQERRPEVDELQWREILDRYDGASEPEKRTLLTAIHKRLALCFAPMAFALLGAGLGGRTKRVGRGQAVVMSIGAMLLYYLTLLGGEHLSRNGIISPQLGSWLATALAALVGLFSILLGGNGVSTWWHRGSVYSSDKRNVLAQGEGRGGRSSAILGLLDRSLIRALCFNFALAYCTLLLIFLIFTLFELLRFISNTEWHLVLLYLLYLVPLASVSLAPISLLVAVLITYALLAKRNEIVVWWVSGQSLYRLALPTILFSLMLSLVLSIVQENVLPQANRKQESYRAQIRGGLNRAMTATGVQWLSVLDSQRLYAYSYTDRHSSLSNPAVYEFDSEGVHLKRVILSENGNWTNSREMELRNVSVIDVSQGGAASISRASVLNYTESTPAESFKPMLNKPSELSTRMLSAYIKALKNVRSDEVAALYVALYRRGADSSAPVILALIGVPFGVLFGRRSTFWALGAALIIGLLFWASASGFQQLGNYKLLPAALAAWATPLIFAALGLILLSRART